MFSLLSATKSFGDRWVGHPTLNRLGLHVARVVSAHGVHALRSRLTGPSDARRALRERGVHVEPGWLPSDEHRALLAEVGDVIAALPPPPPPVDRGFGPPHPFEGGFDRYDGSSLNRLVRIDEGLPHAARVADRLARIGARTSGARPHPEKLWIQQLVQGDEASNPDVQKDLHRDTFHPAFKLWYFLDEVRPGDGELFYVPGSHRLTKERLRWEQRRATEACEPGSPHAGGSFRIRPDELADLGLPDPIGVSVPANTLVVANVRGFHARGPAPAGTGRLAIHGSFRPSPYVPFPY